MIPCCVTDTEVKLQMLMKKTAWTTNEEERTENKHCKTVCMETTKEKDILSVKVNINYCT